MFTRYFTERKLYVFSALILFALILAGCGGKSATNTTTSVSNSLSRGATASPSAPGGTTGTATLKHQPVGTANLNWDPTDHMLTVQLTMTGLAPNSVHPVHIERGSCSEAGAATPGTATPGTTETPAATETATTTETPSSTETSTATGTSTVGNALYSLVNATADTLGVINTSSKVDVPTGIPASGWRLVVYNGPGLSTTAQATPIVCGNVVNRNTSVKSAQSAQVTFEPLANVASQNASGQASLSISGHTLTVRLEMSGLEPKTEHMVHIHSGTCAKQGSAIYPLTALVADSSGKAVSKTTIQNVSTIPATGWYVNVHNSTDLSTQTGFDPIACGDVTLSK